MQKGYKWRSGLEAGAVASVGASLLHGLPSSSRMFEPLFARLADRYHFVAPDYPGFGHSDGPDPKKFMYTFDHYAEIMNHFTEALGLSRYTLYIQDYNRIFSRGHLSICKALHNAG
jgi:pimeloyl-ACP methyl ester carboxylesterase